MRSTFLCPIGKSFARHIVGACKTPFLLQVGIQADNFIVLFIGQAVFANPAIRGDSVVIVFDKHRVSSIVRKNCWGGIPAKIISSQIIAIGTELH